MNKTTNYNLNQWEAGDRVLRTDFNSDNAKLDAALAGLETSKADKTAVNSALAAKGNCRVEFGSYVGTGVFGLTEDKATVLKLGYCPKMLFVWNGEDEKIGFLFYPCARPMTYAYYGGVMVKTHWMVDGLSWWCDTTSSITAHSQFNQQGTTYYWAAFR